MTLQIGYRKILPFLLKIKQRPQHVSVSALLLVLLSNTRTAITCTDVTGYSYTTYAMASGSVSAEACAPEVLGCVDVPAELRWLSVRVVTVSCPGLAAP